MTTHHVVFSGGVDSTTVLSHVLHHLPSEHSVRAIGFWYGQRHERELQHAQAIAATLGVTYQVIPIPGLLHGSALLDHSQPVPHGHYADDNMSETVVPGRNLLFTSLAVAQARPGDSVWLGVHAGDHYIYPDCRPEFWENLAGVVLEAYGVTIRTPYLHATKADIVRDGISLGAPLQLSWSCYEGGDEPCGRCGTCVERAEAFEQSSLQ